MAHCKGRGRPKHSGIVSDEPILLSVAALIKNGPSIGPTGAIKKLVPEWTDSIVHRLCRKWRERQSALSVAATPTQKSNNVANYRWSGSTGMSENEVRQAAMLLEVRRMLDSAVSTTTIFNLEIGNSPAYLKASQVLADAMLDTRLGGIGTVFGSLNGQSGRTESEAIAKALQLMRSKI